jgi:hypothetical protein
VNIVSEAIERRRQKRMAVIGNPVALMRPGPSQPGKVTCIGVESVEIVYDSVNEINPVATEELDILAADFVRPVYLERIPVKVISDSAASGTPNPKAHKRVLAFDRMTAEQRNQLQSFIYSFAYE